MALNGSTAVEGVQTRARARTRKCIIRDHKLREIVERKGGDSLDRTMNKGDVGGGYSRH